MASPGIDALDDSLLRLVIDVLPVGVVVVDPRGDVVLSNPAAQKIWGSPPFPSGEERWKRSRACWHDTGALLEPHEWASARALALGSPQLDQLVDIEAFDGRKRTIRNSAVPIVKATGVTGAVIVIEDVTERLQLAARLAQSQKLEAVGRLAGGVAHDFNNLLTVITTYVDLTLETIPPPDPRHEDLTQVRQAAASAAGLTRQLLAFARREPTEPREVSADEAVRSLAKMLSALLGESIRVELRLGSDARRIRIDPSQLEQIILNLAFNARDAMPRGGELFIETRTVEYSESTARSRGLPRAGVYVELRVRDTGVGMDDETRRRVFEPFFTTKARGRGTGLGLATVYAIVRDNGGAIFVESEADRGTTFGIDLPVARISGTTPAAEVVVAPPQEARPGRGETILLVEDTDAVRAAVHGMLERHGYRVRAAATGAAALVLFETDHDVVDLVLSDVLLPDTTGPELISRMRAKRPELRVLFMSGYTGDATKGTSGLPPGAELVEKPFSQETLARRLRDMFER